MTDREGLTMATTDVATLLGASGAVSSGAVGQLALADAIDSGLAPDALDRVKGVLGLHDAELARILGISLKTIQRMRSEPGRRLGSAASDRLYRMARLYLLATEVLEAEDDAREWLRSSQVGLGGRSPVALMSTEAGSREVESLLLRIEHGVVS